MSSTRFIFSLSLFILTGCNSYKKNPVEDFFEDNHDPGDTSIMMFYFQKDTIMYRDPDMLAAATADENEMHSGAVGYSGIKTDQYKRYEKLSGFASDLDLIRLTDHKNPVVRAYAFEALAERNSGAAIPVFQKHLNDKEEFKSIGGCLAETISVNKCMLLSLQPYDGNESISLSKKEFKKYAKIITGHDNADEIFW
ncbi:MAG TPA: HEAT repeat domain-containing protein [Ferruginibacter sp.]|nr:HEAT repeat domain-containing protein [Ferruginibacter sp.]